MPELPDVEYYKRYIDATALHHVVDTVAVDTPELLKGVSARTLRRHLKGHPFHSTARHGKHLFLRIDRGWMVLHFGMTGLVRYHKQGADLPDYARVRFKFDNGYEMTFDCPRKLGYVSYAPDREEYIRDHNLGIDALDDDLDLDGFRERVGARRGTIKSTLMNQALIAGIGNVYSDEILFRARVRPGRAVTDLDGDELRAVFKAMRKVLPKAADCHADPDRMPRSYLTPHREKDAACPRCNAPLTNKKISGRSSYFCKQCQS